jgi:hypothetical protein
VAVAEVLCGTAETANRLRIPTELDLRVHDADLHTAILAEAARASMLAHALHEGGEASVDVLRVADNARSVAW